MVEHIEKLRDGSGFQIGRCVGVSAEGEAIVVDVIDAIRVGGVSGQLLLKNRVDTLREFVLRSGKDCRVDDTASRYRS